MGSPLNKSKTNLAIDKVFAYPGMQIWGHGFGGGEKEMIEYTLKTGFVFFIILSFTHFILKLLIKIIRQK